MEENIKNNQNVYQCKECSLHYKDREIASKCEAWCKEHKTCNVEITREAEESRMSSFAKASEDELSELKKKCNEYLNNWKRAQADFENYKKNELERATMLIGYAKEDLITKILGFLDNIYLAEKSIPETIKNDPWIEGFMQIKKQMEEFLKKEGIEEIKTEEEQFNPETMEVIEEVEPASAEASAGTVVEELQKGYVMGDKVIRPAKVKVNK